jgi:hypothetical protein
MMFLWLIPFVPFIFGLWAIERKLNKLEHRTHRLEITMSADRAALDAKIQEVAAKYDTTIADIKAVIAALQAKIGTSADFQAEVDALQAVVDKETSDDPGAPVVTPAPVDEPAPSA